MIVRLLWERSLGQTNRQFALVLNCFNRAPNQFFIHDHVRARPIIGLVKGSKVSEELMLSKRLLKRLEVCFHTLLGTMEFDIFICKIVRK
jgi:hypothetical protein